MSENPPVHILYQKYTEKDPAGEYATRLWGRIPARTWPSVTATSAR